MPLTMMLQDDGVLMKKPFVFARAFLAVLIAGSGGMALGQTDEEADWGVTRGLGTSDAYFLYLQRYPRGQYVDEALDFLKQRNALRSGEVSRPRSIKLY